MILAPRDVEILHGHLYCGLGGGARGFNRGVDPDEVLELVGQSDSAWRERIGNAVPPAAAEAIASVMGQTLLLAWAGETFMLSAQPIWVQPIVIALSVRPFDEETLQ